MGHDYSEISRKLHAIKVSKTIEVQAKQSLDCAREDHDRRSEIKNDDDKTRQILVEKEMQEFITDELDGKDVLVGTMLTGMSDEHLETLLY